MRTLNVVGAGRVGRVLARLWHEAGAVRVGAVCNRSRASAAAAVAFIGAGRAVDTITDLPAAELVLLAVPDDAVAAAADTMAAAVALEGTLVFHASGVLGVEPLAAVAVRGAVTGVLHPLASFADPDRMLRSFTGTPCGVSGTSPARAILTELATAIGGRPFTVDGRGKALYHAGAVVASNHLVANMALALRLLEAAGIDAGAARDVAAGLARQTLDNIVALGPAGALTGPVDRGDIDTVRRHLEALGDMAPADRDYYLAAARYLLAAVADLSGRDDVRRRLARLLDGGPAADGDG